MTDIIRIRGNVIDTAGRSEREALVSNQYGGRIPAEAKAWARYGSHQAAALVEADLKLKAARQEVRNSVDAVRRIEAKGSSEAESAKAVERINVDLSGYYLPAYRLAQAHLLACEAAYQAFIAGTRAATAQPQAANAGASDVASRLLGMPAGKKGLPKDALAAIAKCEWPLTGERGVVATVEALVAKGWVRGPLEVSIGQVVAKAAGHKDHRTYSAMVEGLEALIAWTASESRFRPLATRLVHAVLDRSTVDGAAPRFLTRDGKTATLVPQDMAAAYVEGLIERLPPGSPEALTAASGLRSLAWCSWIDSGNDTTYLLGDAKTRAAFDLLASVHADPSRVLVSGGRELAGFTASGETFIHPVHSANHDGDDNAIARSFGSPVATGKFRSKAVLTHGGEILSLSENRDVHYLEAFAPNGSLARRVTLPRPIHHVGRGAPALTKDGRIVYASTDGKSRDVLVSLNPRFNGNDPKRADNLDRVTAQPPAGFKLEGVAVEFDHVFVLQHHDGKNQRRIVRYDLPSLNNPVDRAILPELSDTRSRNIALIGPYIVVHGGKTIRVLQRMGDTAVPVREIPFKGLQAFRPRSGGGADVVLEGANHEHVLVRLSSAEVATLLG